jgi:hypothetical protein
MLAIVHPLRIDIENAHELPALFGKEGVPLSELSGCVCMGVFMHACACISRCLVFGVLIHYAWPWVQSVVSSCGTVRMLSCLFTCLASMLVQVPLARRSGVC